MNTEQRLTRVFVELADTLVDEFDALDFLHTLTERTVELLPADAAGVILTDQHGHLQVVASTSNRAQLLELFELQSAEGPCLDCFTTGTKVANVAPEAARTRWPRFSAAAVEAGYSSTHALPLRLRDQVIGAMNLFCVDRTSLSDDDLMLGQALADVATIGLLQERAVRQSELVAEQLQTALNTRVLIEQAKGVLLARAGVDVDEAFRLMRDYSRRNSIRLKETASRVIDDAISVEELNGN
ncbi:ANTAR domain-containing protein [Nocardioides sp.]|uniref:ANTAR domain-containing protein n=1 Tax=Nocardioides sp. TaxID=35761 RepID=UPI003D1413F2